MPSPATQQESSSRPSEDEEIRHTQEKASVGRQVLALVFLEAIFSRNGRKLYKISSKNNPSVVLFQIDYDYCFNGKRNNRNSTG